MVTIGGAAAVGERRLLSATTGTSLSTTAAIVPIMPGVEIIEMMPRLAATAVVWKYAMCPKLKIYKTADLLVTTPTSYTEEAQDDDTSTVVNLDSFDTIAENEALFLGAEIPFRGLDIDVGLPNGTASVLTAKYLKNDSTWADTSDTDGTISSGKTFAVDGRITWTVPTDWAKESLQSMYPSGVATDGPKYWIQIEVSVQLDSEVELDHVIALPRSTDYNEQLVAIGEVRRASWQNYAGIEALVDDGTAKLLVNGYTGNDSRRFP
jgi:hypothetical protein